MSKPGFVAGATSSQPGEGNDAHEKGAQKYPDIGPRPLARTRSFTRRGGRMPERHHRALDDHGAQYVIDVPRKPGSTEPVDGYRVDVDAEFGRRAPLIVEIGSGAGDQIVYAASENPDVNFIALEVWRPGIAQTISKAVHAGVTNVRLIEIDASEALDRLFVPGTVSEVWTFFPDPWPKSKHHKRRLVQLGFAEVVADVLVPGGTWRLATDWADYAWHMRDVVEESPRFVNPHEGRLADPSDGDVDPDGERGGFAPRFAGRTTTRFENKGLRVDRIVRDLEVTRAN